MQPFPPLKDTVQDPAFLSIPLNGIDQPESKVTFYYGLPYKIFCWKGAMAYIQQCTSDEIMAIFEWRKSTEEKRPMSAWKSPWEKNLFTDWYRRFQEVGIGELLSLTQEQSEFIKNVRTVYHGAGNERPYRDSELNTKLMVLIHNQPEWLKELSKRYPEKK